MFTWICPQCGREVPPSYSECPDCAERAAAAAKAAANPQPPAPPPPAAPPTAPPTTTAPPSAAAPEAGQPQVQYVYVDRPRQPGWLVALLVAIALVGIGGAAYYFLLPSVRASREGADSPKVSLETPKEGASTEVSAAARMRKYLEITGLRIIEQKQRPQLKYVIVNHSSAELAAIKGSLVLRASNAAPDAPPVAVVPIEIPSLDAYGVQEVTTTLKTNLRAYEMPDWQFLKAELQLN